MSDNKERFTGKADLYNKFRPSYPKELLDYLYSEVGFSADSVIADIGAGTGIFSRLLLERGSRVFGVEPNGDMRRFAEQDFAGFSSFTAVNAPAESTGLAAGSVDFITSAQAFHWFDVELFRAECRRILKPGGKVVIVWNTRDFDADFMRREYEIRLKYCVDTKGMNGPDVSEKRHSPGKEGEFFRAGGCEARLFRNDLLLKREEFIGRNLSSSYAPREDTSPEKYYGYAAALSELFDGFAVNGTVNFAHYTESFVGVV